MTDLSNRRSHIIDIEADGLVRTLTAQTPLSELVGYSTHLRALTSGTASFTMQLAQYRIMNDSEQSKLVEKMTTFGMYS